MKKIRYWYLLWVVGFVIIALLIFSLVRSGLERHDQISLLAVIVAFVSLSLSIYVSGVSHAVTRAETFRQLRFVFFEFRKNLPDNWHSAKQLPQGGETSDHFKTMIRYWQYAFDEWFITTQLNPRILRPLWDQYYQEALRAAANSAPMLVALFAAFHGAGPITDVEFLREIIGNLASEDSRREAVRLAEEIKIQIPSGFGLEKYLKN